VGCVRAFVALMPSCVLQLSSQAAARSRGAVRRVLSRRLVRNDIQHLPVVRGRRGERSMVGRRGLRMDLHRHRRVAQLERARAQLARAGCTDCAGMGENGAWSRGVELQLVVFESFPLSKSRKRSVKLHLHDGARANLGSEPRRRVGARARTSPASGAPMLWRSGCSLQFIE